MKRGGKSPWWSAKITKALKRKSSACRRYCTSNNHQKYLEYKRAQITTSEVQRKNKAAYEMRLAQNAKTNPKAFYSYVQSKGTLRGFVGNLKDSSGKLAIENKKRLIFC